MSDRYILLPHGASIGRNYGPILVARRRLDPAELRGKQIAVPGTLTTAALVLRLYLDEFQAVDVLFDRILDSVASGETKAGLLIHEGQLTFGTRGFTKLVDLGAWWHEQSALPLPLWANAIRKDLGESFCLEVSRYLQASIEYGLAHRQEALQYAIQFGRDLEVALADRFVGMYVNEHSGLELIMQTGPRTPPAFGLGA